MVSIAVVLRACGFYPTGVCEHDIVVCASKKKRPSEKRNGEENLLPVYFPFYYHDTVCLLEKHALIPYATCKEVNLL